MLNYCSIRSLLIVVLFGSSIVANVLASSEFDHQCGGPCGDNGSCKPVNTTSECTTAYCKHECVCNHGWTGDDCMLQYEVCEDTITGAQENIRTCYNGGRCEKFELDTPNSNGETDGMRCNCQTDASDTKAYAGHQCEYAAEQVCIRDRYHSSYAFCVNGGTCKNLVDFGELHPLCNCPKGFAGRHCQFKVDPNKANAIPPEEIELINKLFHGNATNATLYGKPYSSSSYDDELSGGMKFLVVLMVFAACALCCFCCYSCAFKKRRSKTEQGADLEESEANDGVNPSQEII